MSTNHSRKPLSGIIAPQQKSTTPFQQQGNILDVRTRKVVQTDFEDVEDDMGRYNAELGQIRQEDNILGDIIRVQLQVLGATNK